MPTRYPQNYQQFSDYEKAYLASAEFCILALRQFVLTAPDTSKNRIVENFVAAAITRLRSIFVLWEEGNYNDCWILHRALLERYILLHRLVREDEFDEFQRWSTQRQFRDAESLLRVPDFFSDFAPDQLKGLQELAKAKRSRMDRDPKINWRRPKARDESRDNEWLRTGYDFGSMKVHPMHDDGADDFARLLLMENTDDTVEISILHDSFVIFHLIIVEWLKASDVSWKVFVFLFFKGIREFLRSGSREYKGALEFALKLDSDVDWCMDHFPEEEGDSEC